MDRLVLRSVGGGLMDKCKRCSLFIAIYPAVISSVFVMPLRDHCFPRTAPPHMLIKVQQRGETLYTHLGVDISVNGV